MATSSIRENGNNAQRSAAPCRYFSNGSCREGNRCRFSHDRGVDRSLINLCKYYQRGTCTYGEFCRFEHVRPRNTRQHEQRSASRNAYANGDRWRTSASSSSNISNLTDLLNRTKLSAEAKEFIPSIDENNGYSSDSASAGQSAPESKDILCPYHILGQCWYGDQCSFTHGTVCDLCDRPLLHPNDTEANRKHREECLAEHERDMQAAFAIARTKDKQCGICMEVVLEKTKRGERRFGILPSCKHCFCLECIRQWRQAKEFENNIIRACPECRTVSDFVVPSSVWVEEEEEKLALVETYKKATKEKPCKYFRDGKMDCPFGNKCFYRHIKPDGTVVEGDSPRTIRRRQRQHRRREGAGSARRGHPQARSPNFQVLFDVLNDNDWRQGDHFDDLIWAFEVEDEFDWMSLTDSESEYYDIHDW